MRLLIIGANGQLGSDFVRYQNQLGYEAIALMRKDIDISIKESVYEALNKYDFDIIINTAAYHGKNAYNDDLPQKHYAINAFGAYYLANYTKEKNKILVHISTDYVFSGNSLSSNKSFCEQDLPKPANLYATSKLAGEHLIQMVWDKYFIFRVASLYGHKGCSAKNSSNFVEMVINKLSKGEKMQIVDDIFMSPTSTKSVVFKTLEVIKTDKYGLYHLAGAGSCSWYEFACEIAKTMDLPLELITPSNTNQIKQEVERGKNTSLTNKNLIDNGFEDLPHWKDNLIEYIKERG